MIEKRVISWGMQQRSLGLMTSFTIHATKDGEIVESVRTSPTLAHAHARMLIKAGWQVRVTDFYSRKYGADGIDEILSFDRKPPSKF
jgi:hypothetical protein